MVGAHRGMELQPFIQGFVPEVPLYGGRPTVADELISGRADAVALSDGGDLIVFGWNSDVAPRGQNQMAPIGSNSVRLHVLDAHRGAIVYMTTGRIDWINSAG